MEANPDYLATDTNQFIWTVRHVFTHNISIGKVIDRETNSKREERRQKTQDEGEKVQDKSETTEEIIKTNTLLGIDEKKLKRTQ